MSKKRTIAGSKPRKASKSKKKKITITEKRFAQLIHGGMPIAEAARRVWGWRCEPWSKEYARAKYLAYSPRVREFINQLEQDEIKQSQADFIAARASHVTLEDMRQYCYDRLIELRNNDEAGSRQRLMAIELLEKLADPAKDINLIWRWIDVLWRNYTAHCPCCHKDFPLWEVQNPRIEAYRKDSKLPATVHETDEVQRKLNLIAIGEKRKQPHHAQMKILSALERHVVGTGAARCLEENERIILSDGSVRKIKNLQKQVFEVPAFGVLGEQTPAKAIATPNGKKPVYKIVTENGKSIVRTAEHPLLWSFKRSKGHGKTTQVAGCQWKEISHIQVGDIVAISRKLNVEGNNPRDLKEVKLLGLMLGDGGFRGNLNFTQAEGKVKDELISLVHEFDCDVRIVPPFTVNIKGKIGTRTNWILDRIKSWGLYKIHSRDKFFPEWVWNLPNSQLSILLNRLFACDGWALARGEIGISLASETMIKDIELALLRFGITGRFRKRLVNCNGRRHKAWCYEISRRNDVIAFADKIGIFGKEHQVAKARAAVEKRNEGNLWRQSGLPEGYEWVEVKSIEKLESKNTISIEVDTYHTFVTTFVEHNSGKSLCMAWMAVIGFLIPGAESWLIARIYDDARSEMEYVMNFLRTMFHPVYDYMVHENIDKKTGEMTLISRWGSELKIRSSKAVGSITGRELEYCLVAEPAWVDSAIFQEVRARMSSRLGRIIAIGTPKGYGGFLHRLVNLSAIDPETGRRLKRNERLVKNGCDWGQSMFITTLEPEDNPEYVTSELTAARKELSDEEFASEFQGLMVAGQGHKFPFVKEEQLVKIPREKLAEDVFILGIDQGPKNFGACLIGWDGRDIHVINEFFDNETHTIKSNMIKLNSDIPKVISVLGGVPERWQLSIFDTDPVISGYFEELDKEHRPWVTPITYKPKNKTGFTNWREETCIWINQMAKEGRLLFDYDEAFQLHQQLIELLIRPVPEGAENLGTNKKGWMPPQDRVRGDHVIDAFLMAMYAIQNNMLDSVESKPIVMDTWNEQRAAQEYLRISDEKRELRGWSGQRYSSREDDELFRSQFRRSRPKSNFLGGLPGYYRDES